MGRNRNGAAWAAVVAVALWAGGAAGQHTPSPGWQPSGSTPSSDPDYFQHQKDAANKWWDSQQQQHSDPQHSVPWWPGGGDPEAPSAEHLMTWMTMALVVGVGAIAVWLCLRVLGRVRVAASDPTKAAMNDPWVRAHLAKSGGLPEDLWPERIRPS